MTFREKVALIRSLYKDRLEIIQYPPTPGSTIQSLSLKAAAVVVSKSVSLPLNPTVVKLTQDASNKLAGKDKRSKSSTGLAPKSYLKRPEFKDKSYRVTGKVNLTQPAEVPFHFRALQSLAKASATPGVILSHTETTEMEQQLRRTEVVLSHQDWFLGAVRTLVEMYTRDMETVPELLTQALELLQSGSRAGFDAQHLTSHLTQNLVLRRRDTYLKDTLWDLPEASKRILRQHNLDDNQLFAIEDCEKVLKTYTEGANARSAQKASGGQGWSQGQSSSSARRPQNQGRGTVMERSYPAPTGRQPWSQPSPARGGKGQQGRGRGKRQSSYTPQEGGE